MWLQENKITNLKLVLKLFGAIIVAIFGLHIILGTFGWELLPAAILPIDRTQN